MPKMKPDEIRSFLAAGTRTGKLATTRQDGRPHFTPIWFVLDGEDVIFNTGVTSVKGTTLARDPAEYGRRNGVAGELVVRLRPARVISEHGVAS